MFYGSRMAVSVSAVDIHDRVADWELRLTAAVQHHRGLQGTRVSTREESGVLGFPSRRGLTPRGYNFQCASLVILVTSMAKCS